MAFNARNDGCSCDLKGCVVWPMVHDKCWCKVIVVLVFICKALSW